MHKLQGNVECIVACEVLPWPDCRRPSDTFTHPTPSEAAKPPEPVPFRVWMINNTIDLSFCVFLLLKGP